MDNILYFFRIEIKGLPGSLLPASAKGAVLNCVSAGHNQEEAVKKMRQALSEDKYELVKIDEAHLFDEMIFNPTDEEHREFINMPEDVRRNGEVFYGPFYCWEE